MKDFILLLVVVVLLAPSGLSSATSVGDVYDFPLAEGMVAMQSADTNFSSADESVTPFPLCRCGGTGKETSGDGLEKFPCVCQPNCKCKAPNGQGAVGDAQPDIYTCYYFTATWCTPCRMFKMNGIPELTKLGWKIVEDDYVAGAQMVIVDIDKNPAKFADLREPTQNLIPTFTITKNGKMLSRHVGSITTGQFTSWYNKVVNEDKAKK